MSFKNITTCIASICLAVTPLFAASVPKESTIGNEKNSVIFSDFADSEISGCKISNASLPKSKWPFEIKPATMSKMFDFMPLNICEFKLSQDIKTIGFQWPDKRVVLLQNNGTESIVFKGTSHDTMQEVVRIAEKNIALAFYGTGILLRKDEKLLADINYGLKNSNVKLIISKDIPSISFRNIEICKPLFAWLTISAAEKYLTRSERLFKENESYILKNWSDNEKASYLLKKWSINYQFLQDAIKNKRDALTNESNGWVCTLAKNSEIVDYYNALVQFSSAFRNDVPGYMGDFFQKNWYSCFAGLPEYQESAALLENTENLVKRASRLSKVNFEKGLKLQSPGEKVFSAGFISSLETVPKDSTFIGELAKSYTIEMAKGEYQSFQLVLSADNTEIPNLSINMTEIKGPSEIPPANCSTYLVQYIRLMEPFVRNRPSSPGGDKFWPDPLLPLSPDKRFSVKEYNNQPIWFTVKMPEEALPGEYMFNVQIKSESAVLANMPVKIKVFAFALGKNRLDSAAGLRSNELADFYGKEFTPDVRKKAIKLLLDHGCNPIDIYNASPAVEDLQTAMDNGLNMVIIPRYENLAAPREETPRFVKLYGSRDGKSFTEIKSDVKLVPQGDPVTSDWDLSIEPLVALDDYRFIKIHYSEIRDWYNRCPYSYFKLDLNSKPVKITGENLAEINIEGEIKYKSLDKTPANDAGSFSSSKLILNFDNVREDKNLTSILFEIQKSSRIKNINLINCNRKINIAAMEKSYKEFKSIIRDRDIKILSYGYDEVVDALLPQLLSSLQTSKKCFPDVLTMTTCTMPRALPEIYKYLDIICPTNCYLDVRFEKEMCCSSKTKIWTYLGAGAYYPYPNFERVDQPLINSRAFFWPLITLNLQGWLYWDINMWRHNNKVTHKWPEIWDEWYTNRPGDRFNGMAALIYPGPDATPIPSMRLEVMRDGIQDYNYFKIAEDLLNTRIFKDTRQQNEIKEFLNNAKLQLSPSKSGFLEDQAEFRNIRSRLASYIEIMNSYPVK